MNICCYAPIFDTFGVYDFASEERRVIGKRWFVDDDVDTLYRTLTEVVGVAFHSQSIDTYDDLFLRSDHRCLFVCTLLGCVDNCRKMLVSW